MSKPAKNSPKLFPRLFPSQRRAEGTPTRGRHKTPVTTISPRRRVRLLFFSTWGSDYKQIDFSAKAFGGMLCGFALIISALAVLATQTITRFVQEYRLAALAEEHQILRSHFKQMETRVHNLSKRVNGADEEEPFGLTQNGDAGELPALVSAPHQDSIANSASSPPAPAVAAKRGPLGLAWIADDNAGEEKEQNFYGQGGGAYVDDDDNIYPTRDEKERLHPTRLSATAEASIVAGAEPHAGNDLLSQLEKNLSKTQELQKTIMEKFEIRRKQLEHIPSIKPLLSGRITDFFGKRVDPFVWRTRHHQGLDIGAPRGTEVFAPANGVIEFVKTTYRRNSGYGKAVVINHGYGVKTLYGHLSDIKVKNGQKIERWDIIGLVGETGRATGPHLHYEVWVDGETCDPLRFILNN
jgi:murein DD-endopeptidase MepM/ murein hydrolase activator NlpD